MLETPLAVALVVSIPPTLVAISGLIIGLRGNRKADAIHVLANSQLTKVQADLTSAHSSIKELQQVIATLAKASTIPRNGVTINGGPTVPGAAPAPAPSVTIITTPPA